MNDFDMLLFLAQSIIFIVLGMNMVSVGLPSGDNVEVFNIGNTIEHSTSDNSTDQNNSIQKIRSQTVNKKSATSNILGTLALLVGFLEIAVLSMWFVFAK